MALSKSEIKPNILSNHDADLDTNFIGLAVNRLEHGQPKHAAIIIHSTTLGSHFCHFDGSGISLIKLNEEPEVNYYKVFDLISPTLIDGFIGHCKKLDGLRAEWGFYFPGAFYEEGVYKGKDNFPPIMTCVGFCVNALKGYILDDYLVYNDWMGNLSEDYITNWFETKIAPHHDNVTLDQYKVHALRISPLDYVTSGFFKPAPIHKAAIDEISEIVREVINEKEAEFLAGEVGEEE